jgi:glycosyltransferase involved in cell wall biosynthesis
MKRIINSLISKRNQGDLLKETIEQIASIRKINEVLAIIPDNTGYSWLGIKNGAIALFPQNHICLPQYYSNSVFNKQELEYLCDTITQLKFKKIVFRGFPRYFKDIIISLRNKDKSVGLYLLFGGFLSEFSANSEAKDIFMMFVELKKNGIVDKIGFNKNGLAETVRKLYKVDAHQYYNKTKIEVRTSSKTFDKQNILIGVLGNKDYRKNIDSQVASGLLIDNAQLFVKNKSSVEYLDITNTRIKEFPKTLPHQEYVSLLHNMTLNSYVSFSESWGHVILESMAGGVPCLASDTSSIFDDNLFLKDCLIVNKLDDSYAIYNKSLSILENYEKISEECCKHVININNKSDELMRNFLNS